MTRVYEVSKVHCLRYIVRNLIHREATQADIDFLKSNGITLTDSLSQDGNSTLHLVVSMGSPRHFFWNKGRSKNTSLEVMLSSLTETENRRLGELVNHDGMNLLHVAAAAGNTKAADLLAEAYPCMLHALDKKGNNREKFKLMVLAVSSKAFCLAAHISVQCMCEFDHDDTDALLTCIAENYPDDLKLLVDIQYEFRHGIKPKMGFIYSAGHLGTYAAYIECLRGIERCFKRMLYKSTRPFCKTRLEPCGDAYILLSTLCLRTRPNPVELTALFEAARQDKAIVIREIMHHFPEAIWAKNEDGHNFIQVAVINRSQNVYNLLNSMSQHKHLYKTIKDNCGNNLLHLASKVAPMHKLKLIRGASFQMQRELQWVKEVERFGCPLNKTDKNAEGETPGMVFTREHQDLLTQGDKWLKGTANSFSIVAALITTFMFAAAITVPGGSNQETGVPLYSKHASFWVFALSDTISLFTSMISLFMFLSILTTRFGEQDFLYKLPTKLTIGLFALFISTTSMVVAFGAAVIIVFGHGHGDNVHFMKIAIPIISVLAGFPITCFVVLQLSLVRDLLGSTYGRGIFGKKRFKECIY